MWSYEKVALGCTKYWRNGEDSRAKIVESTKDINNCYLWKWTFYITSKIYDIFKSMIRRL